jgi:pimeloyl-ACP methyl ester carboxylesterase
VLTYDRRGHSFSERPSGQDSITDDVADLSALLDYLDLVPANIFGHSYGGNVALRLASKQPELFRSMLVHEPGLYELNQETLANELVAASFKAGVEAAKIMESGQLEAGARMFVESAFGPNAWENLLEDTRKMLVANAPAFIDEANDPESFSVDLSKLANCSQPILITQGEYSPPAFKFMADQLEKELPQAQALTIPGGGHSPHIDRAEAYAAIIKSFIEGRLSQNL